MNTVETTGKKILCVLLSVALLVGMMPAVAFAEETPPQSVRTAEEFAAMESGGDYILEADITVSSPYSSFGGTFDGNGHTITLAIESDSSNTGLFGTLTGGGGGEKSHRRWERQIFGKQYGSHCRDGQYP